MKVATSTSMRYARTTSPRAITGRKLTVMRAEITALVKVYKSKKPIKSDVTDQAEQLILDIVSNAKGRGKSGLTEDQVEQLETAVTVLEAARGVDAPTTREELDGKWRLLYTSRPGTASPIQRTFTGVDAFSVFQEVTLQDDDKARVNNIVDFGPKFGFLKVEAEASTDTRPLEGFTPRQGEGLRLFGKSFTYPPANKDMRIDFRFDQAGFYFKFLPFTIPYPVPFRILGDEVKGWIDVTYMNEDGTFRLSRGNKGTLFVLSKDLTPRQKLAKAIGTKDDEVILQAIEAVQKLNPTPSPATSSVAAGVWRLVWSQQAANASALQKFGSRQADSFQIIDGEASTLQNLVNLGSFIRIQAQAECSAESPTRTNVFITEASISLGPFKINLPTKGSGNPGYIDWLYLDERMRVTRGSKGSLFVHMREEQ